MRFLTFAFLLTIISPSFAQEKIDWISFQEAIEKNKKEPRKIIVDVYTDWCGWCKKMDHTTFENPEIAKYINQNYWAVKFDAEGNDTIDYKGKTYTNTPPVMVGGRMRKNTHPLAQMLLNGRMSYPSLVYMDDSSNVIAPIGGYRDAKGIQPFLVYFVENLYKYTDLQQFTEDFDNAFSNRKAEDSLTINWTTATDAFARCEKEDKNILIYFYADWSVPSTIMTQVAFEDSVVATYTNENFIPVLFNVVSGETVTMGEHTFVNQGKEHPYHDFAVSLLNGKMETPVIVILSSKKELITRTPGYFTNKNLEPILHYFNEGAYKTTKWPDYQSAFKSDIK